MPTCKSCGKETAEAKFCQYCGSPLEPAAPAGTTPPPSPTATAQSPAASVTQVPPPGAPMAPAAPQPPGAVQPPMAPPPGMAPAARRPVTATFPPTPAGQRVGRESSGAQIWGGIGIAAMALAAICSFLPWANIFFESASGWELGSDAKISFGLAIGAALFFLAGLISKARWPFVVGLIVTIITGAVLAIDLVDVMDTLSSSNVGFGLYVGIGATFVGLVAAVGGIAARRD